MKKSADYNVFIKMLEKAESKFEVEPIKDADDFIFVEVGSNHVSTIFCFDKLTGELSHIYSSD